MYAILHHGRVKGGGRNKSTTETHGTNETVQSSWSHAYGETHTTTHTESETIGGGIAESFHKKPLLEPNEFNWLFNPIDEKEKDHPRYPGFALVRIQGEHAFFVRRSHYDQDPFFESTFSADPVHGYLPLNQIPLLGYQYTEDHVFPIKFPEQMVNEKRFKASALLRPMQRFVNGDKLFSFVNSAENNISVPAPFSGRIMEIANDDTQAETGAILTVKADIPIRENDRTSFKRGIFEGDIQQINKIIRDKEHREQTKNKIEEIERAMSRNTDAINRLHDQTETRLYKHLEKSFWAWMLMPVLIGISVAGDTKGFWASIGAFLGIFIGFTAIIMGVMFIIAKIREFRWSGHNQEIEKLRGEYQSMAKKKQNLEKKL